MPRTVPTVVEAGSAMNTQRCWISHLIKCEACASL